MSIGAVWRRRPSPDCCCPGRLLPAPLHLDRPRLRSQGLMNSTVPYTLSRLHVVMTPEPGNPLEAEGVLNPASGRTPDGQLYLLPRLVAAGNVSRVGIARVVLTGAVPADLRAWRRLGPVHFEYQPELDADLNLCPNKDVVFFPEVVPGPDGVPCYAMIH